MLDQGRMSMVKIMWKESRCITKNASLTSPNLTFDRHNISKVKPTQKLRILEIWKKNYRLSHPSLIRDVNQAGRARAKNTSLSLDLLFSQRLCRSADGLVMVYFSQSVDPRVAGGRAKFCLIVKTLIAYAITNNKNIASSLADFQCRLIEASRSFGLESYYFRAHYPKYKSHFLNY